MRHHICDTETNISCANGVQSQNTSLFFEQSSLIFLFLLQTYVYLGYTYLAINDYSKAEENFHQAIQLTPPQPSKETVGMVWSYYFQYVKLLMAQKKWQVQMTDLMFSKKMKERERERERERNNKKTLPHVNTFFLNSRHPIFFVHSAWPNEHLRSSKCVE
jgi:tetratricopeptide (TPR) repeat protein